MIEPDPIAGTRMADGGTASRQSRPRAVSVGVSRSAVAKAVSIVLVVATLGGSAACADIGPAQNSKTPLTRPFEASAVISAFARHGLRLEVFSRSTDCTKAPKGCHSPAGLPVAPVQLQVAKRGVAFRWSVVLYRSAADAALSAPASLVRSGKTDWTGAQVGYLRQENVVVDYIANTVHLSPSLRGFFKSAATDLAAIRASLASL